MPTSRADSTAVTRVFIAVSLPSAYDNCCAVLTSHLNPYQLRILLSLRVRVVIAFDEEVDPRKDEEIKKLKHFCQVDWVRNRDRLLGEKMAPVDNGADVWNTLYSKREQIT